jgi:hypothetical protein
VIYFNKEVRIGDQWHRLDSKQVNGPDELFIELIKEHADHKRENGTLVTALERRFHGDRIVAEGTFSLRNLMALGDAWARHHRNPRKDFGCFPFDYLDQLDEDIMYDLKKEHAIESIRVIAWIA